MEVEAEVERLREEKRWQGGRVEDLKAELARERELSERLRGENRQLKQAEDADEPLVERVVIMDRAEAARLHRIKEAARMVLDAPDDIERGKRLFDLRAALEEKP